HYWSIDKLHWYECVNGTFTDVDQSILDKATNEGNMKAPSPENGRYTDMTVDLSQVEGDEITLYLAVAAAGNGEKLLHYLTVENVVRYIEETTEEPTEEVTEEPTEEPTEEITEEPTEEVTEVPTEEITEAPTAEPTEEVTEAPTAEATTAETTETQTDSGCGAVVGLSAGALLTAMAAAVVLRKRRD
ncbi:MAG: hypothetical protein IKU90_06645, partial [Clostridia bacterium]|nr:hypothetical protein [Clostridia bacterium]